MSKLTKQGVRDLGYSKPKRVTIPPDSSQLLKCFYCKSTRGSFIDPHDHLCIPVCKNCNKEWIAD